MGTLQAHARAVRWQIPLHNPPSPLHPFPAAQDNYLKKKGKWLKPVFEWVQAHGNEPIIPFSGAYENEVGGARARTCRLVLACVQKWHVSLGRACVLLRRAHVLSGRARARTCVSKKGA